MTNRFGATIAAATLTAGVLALALQPAEAAFSGANGRIAFQSNRDGNSEIYAMNPDGTNPTRLTNNGAWEGEPAVSPEGKRITFVTDRHGGPDHEELYVMDARDTDGDGNGDNPLRLTNDTTPDWSPSFSPDGTKITYQEYGDGDSEIFVMNADGTGTPIRLTDNTLFDGNPRFSPNGTKIYFDTDRDGDSRNFTELYAMDAVNSDGDGDGDNQAQLFGGTAIDYFASAVSPDATRLAYQDYADGDSEIYVKNLDGTGTPTRLTTNATWDGLPAYSPDGKKLVFATDRDLGLEQEEIYTMDVVDTDGDGNGDNLLRLTDDTTADYDPEWGAVIPPPGCTIVGTAGKDVIPASKSPGDDTICTLGGDDQVDAGAGDDTVKGGGGADTLVGGLGSDKAYGEAGADTLNVRDGVKGNDLADGGPGTDTCTSDRKDKLMSCP
jgi:Tol biopolymer transport system component